MKKISIIVDVLDGLDHLSQCMDTICGQEGIEHEIILISNVYDAATIKNSVQNFDFKVVSNLELTLGSLINVATSEISGDYVCFARANDFYEKNSLTEIITKMEKDNTQLAVGRVFEYDEKNGSYELKKIAKSLTGCKCTTVGENREVIDETFLYNKVFATSLIKNSRVGFTNTQYYSHLLFYMESLLASNNFSILSKPHYVERVKCGLDKVKNPLPEDRIDENQVDDMIAILMWVKANCIDVELCKLACERFVIYMNKRGIKYKNISEDEVAFLNKVSGALGIIKSEEVDFTAPKYKALSLVRDKKYDEYFDLMNQNRINREKKKNLKVYLTYTVFSKMYEILSKFPVRKKRVLFISHTKGMDGNFSYISEAIKEHNEDVSIRDKFECRYTETQGSLWERVTMPIRLARAEFIVLCENVPFFQHIQVREETKVIQSWHAAGAFKKFGYSTNYMSGGPNPFEWKKMGLHKGYTHATVSSQEVVKHYADAFMLDENNVIPIGLPRTDFFFRETEVNETRSKIFNLYPKIKGKKVILYAPTFRGFGKERKNFKMEFDFNRVAREISDDYVIMLKLHPSVQASDIKIDKDVEYKVVNASGYKEANDILTVTDLLITDYSSIIFDYSLMGKPMLFYAYDLEDYLFDRDFYYKYEEFVPGDIVRSNDSLIEAINANEFDIDKVKRFCDKFFVARDGNSSRRFVEEVLLKK